MRHRVTVEQERYILQEMQNLEEYLSLVGFSRQQINMATISVSADLEFLLLAGVQVLRVEYESFVEFLRDMEKRSERSVRLSRNH